MTELLAVEKLSVSYGHGKQRVRAVDNVSFIIQAGETVGLVGESGCGKSSLARALLRLEDADGSATFNGQDWLALRGDTLRRARRQMQAVFQDPLASLNPRMNVRNCLLEPLSVHQPTLAAPEREKLLQETIKRVGLDAEYLERFPHELSGGQCQRIAIGRALISKPALVILDEPVSALDMSIRGQVLGLLATLQRDQDTAYLFIAHDMAAVRYLCQRVLVMFAGEVVESGQRDEIFEHPAHPYTRELLRAVLPPERDSQPPGDLNADALSAPAETGCPFAPRCPHATETCRTRKPPLRLLDNDKDIGNASATRKVACHHSEKLPPWTD